MIRGLLRDSKTRTTTSRDFFPILSSAREQTDVILASFSENIVVAGTSYKMLGILSLTDREAALPSSTEISELTFEVKKNKTKQNNET